jgi:hypothetical protein
MDVSRVYVIGVSDPKKLFRGVPVLDPPIGWLVQEEEVSFIYCAYGRTGSGLLQF